MLSSTRFNEDDEQLQAASKQQIKFQFLLLSYACMFCCSLRDINRFKIYFIVCDDFINFSYASTRLSEFA